MTPKMSRLLKSILLAIVFLFGILFLTINPADNRQTNNENLIRKTENETFVRIPGLVLDEGYRRLTDTLKLVRDWKVSRLKGIGAGLFSMFIGTQDIYECDSCYSFDESKFRYDYRHKYYIRLNGYTLRDGADFSIEGDRYYINYFVVDSLLEDGSQEGHTGKKEISVRYSTESINSSPSGSLLVPVAKKTYRLLNSVAWVLAIILTALFIGVLIIFPAVTLYHIASGRPFTKQNINRIFITGWTLLGIAVLPALISVIIQAALAHKIPHEIYYPFWLSVIDNRPFLIAGLAVLVIATAFKRGYKLQQEQELTV